MADQPLTYQLVAAVRTCLAQIRKSAGYWTDAGSYASAEPESRQDTSDDDQPPYTLDVVLEKTLTPTDAALKGRARACVIAIIARVPVGLTDAEIRLHELLEDIERAMQDQQSRFPEGADFPRFAGSEAIAPAKGVSWSGAIVRYTANVRR